MVLNNNGVYVPVLVPALISPAEIRSRMRSPSPNGVVNDDIQRKANGPPPPPSKKQRNE